MFRALKVSTSEGRKRNKNKKNKKKNKKKKKEEVVEEEEGEEEEEDVEDEVAEEDESADLKTKDCEVFNCPAVKIGHNLVTLYQKINAIRAGYNNNSNNSNSVDQTEEEF